MGSVDRTAVPKVVVAMPTYNHARFIVEAIESVRAQTLTQWQLVIVDDGSTDGTVELARAFGDDRIVVLTRAHRGLAGLGSAYDQALSISAAPLVAILEGDDRWPPDKLERQVADFEDPAVVLSYGVGGLIDECGCEYGYVVPFSGPDRWNRPVGSILPSLLSSNPILSPTVVVRRAALDAIGGFLQPTGVPYVDHPTWLALASEGAFAYHETVVGWWRRHAAQWTTRTARSGLDIPEAGYVEAVAGCRSEGRVWNTGSRSASDVVARHRSRAQLNRWRLALLAAGPREVAAMALELFRSGDPRFMASALLGIALWTLGSDLEWIQLRRHRVAWPPRRHRHSRACWSTGGGRS